MIEFNYSPDGQAIVDFMSSDAFVRGLCGPIGSGKSVACVSELFRLALMQEPSIDPRTGNRTGPRKVKSGVIRNTSPMLESTTMATWLEWLPEDQFGRMRWRPPFKHQIYIPEINLEWEVWFLALDREEDVRKLLSFEFTNVWINEAREVSRGIVTAAISRVDRFPRVLDGGATRACVIMDTNAPDEEHWWAIMSGMVEPPDWLSQDDILTLVKPDNWAFFFQPPAMLDDYASDGTLRGYTLNPERNNARFTSATYYENLIQGQSRDWIRNMVQNQIGRSFAGRPVYRDFNERVHVAAEPIEAKPGLELFVGMDFGKTPAVCIGQIDRGQVRIIEEIVTRDMNATQFAPIVRRHLAEKYPNFTFRAFGDPTGENDNDVIDTTPFQVFRANGIDVKPAWSNDPTVRIGAIQTQLNTMVEGRPGYLLSPACTYLLAGKKGGYCYKKNEETVDKKSIYSHVADAEQYMALGMGLGKALIGRGTAQRLQVQAKRDFNVFDRAKGFTPRQARLETILSRRRP